MVSLGRTGPLLVRASPIWAVSAVFLAFAVIPWTGEYLFGDSSLSVLPARLDWGLLFAVMMLSLSGLVRVLADVSSGDPAVVVTGGRRAARLVASGMALWLALLPMLLIFQTLWLSGMVAQQDSVLWLKVSGLSIALPAWGILFNPPAALVFLLAAMAHSGLSPFTVNAPEEELAGGRIAREPATGSASLALADGLKSLLIAALVSLLFFGGWSLPWLPQSVLEAFLVSHLGSGLGSVLCLMVQFTVFALKVAIVLRVQRVLARALSRVRFEPMLNLCWKLLLPAALIDSLSTALILRWLAGNLA